VIEIPIWVLSLLWSFACFFSIGMRALRNFSRHELEELCHRRNRQARLGEILRRHEQVALGVESALMMVVAAATIATAQLAQARLEAAAAPTSAVVAIAIAGVMLLWLVVIWIPRAASRLWAAPLLMHTWLAWSLLHQIARPSLVGAYFFDGLFHRLAGKQPRRATEESFEDEIRSIVTEGHREGLLEEDAREMIEGVIELGDADAAAVMTPRTELNAIHVGQTLAEAVDYVVSCGRTRIPVFNKNRDDIVGILYTKDLLRALARPADAPKRSLAEILRQPHFVPETKPIDALLQEFQRTGNHMAIVLDEYGGVSGVVTIEDVLEEIVGEIIDEYDGDLVEQIKKIDETTWEALAKTHVDEINEQMGIDLPEDDDFDTVGGFVFSQLGRIPRTGEQVLWNESRITVLEVSRRRIERVRIELVSKTRQETA
jgi:CBS domain containing-hemolysin-like protein